MTAELPEPVRTGDSDAASEPAPPSSLAELLAGFEPPAGDGESPPPWTD